MGRSGPWKTHKKSQMQLMAPSKPKVRTSRKKGKAKAKARNRRTKILLRSFTIQVGIKAATTGH